VGLWIDGSVLPSVIHNTQEIRRYGYGATEKRPIVSSFQDVQLRVMSDATGMAWELFRRWMQKVNNFDSRLGMSRIDGQTTSENAGGIPMQAYESSYPSDYTTPVVISVYTPDGNELKRVILTEAYPSALSDIELAWDNNDQIARFTVNMAIQDWYVERT
jgi:hypothetical protein